MYDNKGKICDYVTLTLDNLKTKTVWSNTVPDPIDGVYEYTVPLSAYYNHERSQAVSVSLVSGFINTSTNQSDSLIISYESGCINSYNNVIGFTRPQLFITEEPSNNSITVINNKLHYIDNAQPIEIFTQPRPTKIFIKVSDTSNDVMNDISAIVLTLKFTYYNEQETSAKLHNQYTALLK